MSAKARGLYEVLVTEALERELQALEPGLNPQRGPVHASEVADRVSLHVARIIRRELDAIVESKRTQLSTEVARTVIDTISEALPRSRREDERPTTPGELLKAIVENRPDGALETITPPLTPLLDTTLLTNAPGEPRVGQQVLGEIESADRIDLVMAFIRRSGLRPLLPALRRRCKAARPFLVPGNYISCAHGRTVGRGELFMRANYAPRRCGECEPQDSSASIEPFSFDSSRQQRLGLIESVPAAVERGEV